MNRQGLNTVVPRHGNPRGGRRVARLALRRLRRLLYPPSCAYCAGEVEDEAGDELLCLGCRRDLVAAGEAVCPRCGLVDKSNAPSAVDCATCRAEPPRIECVAALGSYDGPLRSAVLRTKHSTGEVLAIALGRLLASQRRQRLADFHPDVLVPVPMHWRRRLVRGINAPEVVAAEVARALGVEAGIGALRRRRATRPQTDLALRERLVNLRGALELGRGCRFDGARVLIVDDVMTTGATCQAAARVLRSAGAAQVSAAVVARAPSDVS